MLSIGRKKWFSSIWDTRLTSTGSSSSNQIKLPLVSNGNYDFIVDWGDGISETINSWNQEQVTHTYQTEGIYKIKILGNIEGWAFKNTGDRLKLLSIQRWGTLKLGDTTEQFWNCHNLDLSKVADILDLSETTSLYRCFMGCFTLKHVNFMNRWDLSNINSLEQCFEGAINFNTNIGNWNISNVTTLRNCFANARKFNNGGSESINNWDTSNVTNMRYLFGTDTYTPPLPFTSTPIHEFNQPIGNWNTSNVTTFEAMFNRNNNFNQDLSTKVVTVNGNTYTAWDTSNVTNMGFMFNSTVNKGKFNRNIGNWNTSKVTIMSSMFSYQPDFNQDISTKVVTVGENTYTAWDTSNVTSMSFILNAGTGNIGKFNQNIGNWNTSKVTAINSAFRDQADFNQDISTKVVTVGENTYTAWDTSNVTSMSFMFYISSSYGEFNQNIGNWNTSKVTNMSVMFSNQADFNQDISTKVVTVGENTYTAWDTLNVTNMSYMLWQPNTQGKFNQNIGNWNTSKVTVMNSILSGETEFNQDISTKVVTVGSNTYTAWDTLNVTNMSYILWYNRSFNQNIGNWNTSKVTNMNAMLYNTNSFNQNIGNWNISLVTTFNGSSDSDMFAVNTGLSTENYDNLLIGWASRPVKPNISINFGTIKRTTASDSAILTLISSPNNWIIIDGGLI